MVPAHGDKLQYEKASDSSQQLTKINYAHAEIHWNFLIFYGRTVYVKMLMALSSIE